MPYQRGDPNRVTKPAMPGFHAGQLFGPEDSRGDAKETPQRATSTSVADLPISRCRSNSLRLLDLAPADERCNERTVCCHEDAVPSWLVGMQTREVKFPCRFPLRRVASGTCSSQEPHARKGHSADVPCRRRQAGPPQLSKALRYCCGQSRQRPLTVRPEPPASPSRHLHASTYMGSDFPNTDNANDQRRTRQQPTMTILPPQIGRSEPAPSVDRETGCAE